MNCSSFILKLNNEKEKLNSVVMCKNKKSIWLHSDDSEFKVQIRLDNDRTLYTELHYIIKCYHIKKYELNCDIHRICINPKDFWINVIDKSSPNETTCIVRKYNELNSEDIYFQQSLINDFGDIQFDDLTRINEIRNYFVNKYAEYKNV